MAALRTLASLLACLAAALVASGLVVAAIGADPLAALGVLVRGAFGSAEALGYTLTYATSFLLAGLAVAVAFHGGLFNIGGEGQAMIGGLGAGLAALALDGWPAPVPVVGGLIAAAGFGALWALVPGWLQARRGSHIVITTIMFNFIASALVTWLVVDVLAAPGQPAAESRTFATAAWLPGLGLGHSPLTVAWPLALAAAAGLAVALWHTRWGYALRVVGASPRAAVYAGIDPGGTVIGAMVASGALAGLVGAHEILGVQHRLLLDFTGGAGFVGVAVALLGGNRPLGVVLAALLFGALAQGGSELAFEMPVIQRDLVVVIQGLVILFAAAGRLGRAGAS
jgi:simple sugar transport system permease protein